MTMKSLLAIYSIVAGSFLYAGCGGPTYTDCSSTQFITRWSFQKLCNHTFDPRTKHGVYPTREGTTTFDPQTVQVADIIFVRNIDLFFKKMHPKITVPYIILTHGERLEAVQEKQLSYLDDEKVIAWFAIHPCNATHPKFFPIPLGVLQKPWIYNRSLFLHETFLSLKKNCVKKHLLYMNFADSKKPERQSLKKRFENKDYCLKGLRKSFMAYLKEMSTCKFILSPEGLAPDCYRHWEALLVGSIPVVKKSQLDPLFENLPVLIVDKWDDITEEFLNKQYEKINSKVYDSAPLYMDYWTSKIFRVRDLYKSNSSKTKSEQ